MHISTNQRSWANALISVWKRNGTIRDTLYWAHGLVRGPEELDNSTIWLMVRNVRSFAPTFPAAVYSYRGEKIKKVLKKFAPRVYEVLSFDDYDLARNIIIEQGEHLVRKSTLKARGVGLYRSRTSGRVVGKNKR